jgi:hypothetical protein
MGVLLLGQIGILCDYGHSGGQLRIARYLSTTTGLKAKYVPSADGCDRLYGFSLQLHTDAQP